MTVEFDDCRFFAESRKAPPYVDPGFAECRFRFHRRKHGNDVVIGWCELGE